MLRYARVLAGLFLSTFVSGAYAQIQFEDVSAEAGMTGGTESWGASWGDMNGDKWPDLFNQGHRSGFPRMYRNTGEGTFQDVAYEMDPGNWIAFPYDDKHGAAWVDFNNDGNQGLHVTVSATGQGQFLVNENGTWVNRASQMNLTNDSTARLPVWFDYNRDGHLDVGIATFFNVIMRRRNPSGGPYSFVTDNGTGVSCSGHVNYGQLIDLNHDGIFEFVCGQEGIFPYRVYDPRTRPFTNVTSLVPTASNVNNSILADFDGDLRYDMVLTTGALRGSGATLADNNRIEGWLRKASGSQSNPAGFTFSANGQVTFTIDHRGMGVYEASKVLVLNSSGTNSGNVGPVSITYNSGTWRVQLNTSSETQAYITVITQQTASNVQDIGLETPELPTSTIYLKTGGTPNLSYSFNTGLFEPVSCVSGVAGDFDNDMDVDLYLVCRRGTENLPNILFENQGDGTFVRRFNHGGEGPLGAGHDIGVGESVVMADYDLDGFLDLYVTNGLLFYPYGIGGQDTLLRNVGNGNHWIQIDLQGTLSNRDGVGAKVYVTAGGKTQVREQNGGYHRWSQNHQRIHFGLAGNTTADVRIEWPSGSVNTFSNVASNTLYDAVENGAMTPAVIGPPVYTALEAGDECGQPPYNLDYGPAVLLWRDCPSNNWFLRAKGGRAKNALLYTEGSIEADAPFSGVAPFSLSGSDFVDNGTPESVVFSVGVWFSNDKGINFNTSGQTQACFDLGTQDIATLIVGGSKKRIYGNSFDLVTLGACATPPPPPPVPEECGDPMLSPASDNGVFLWRDCDHAGSDARWNLTVSPGGTAWREHAGMIVSDVVLSATGVGLEAHDTLDSTPGDGVIDFRLFAGGNNTDGFQVDVPEGSQTCFTTTLLPPGVGVFVGADRVARNEPFDMLTLGSCEGPPPPPPPGPECGAPSFNQTSERGLFLWRNCEAGPHQEWHVRVTGGGGPFDEFSGSVLSTDSVLTATGFDLEPHDTLDSAPGDGFVDYSLFVGGSGIDGFELIVPEGATACFDASILPTGTEVQLGADRQVVSTPFELTTLGACN